MRIAAAQFAPVAGDFDGNLARHLALVEVAASGGVDVVVFPELSLTGFEPRLAKDLVTGQDDVRLGPLQRHADVHDMIIAVGLPTAACGGIRISMIVFRPGGARLTYSKQRLHADELPYFVHGTGQVVFPAGCHTLAPAICYESLQADHAAEAARMGADVYLASVAKPAQGIGRAYAHYPIIAREHSMTVVMANSLGPCDDFVSVGGSAIWNRHGERVGSLDDQRAGLLAIDTRSGSIEAMYPPALTA